MPFPAGPGSIHASSQVDLLMLRLPPRPFHKVLPRHRSVLSMPVFPLGLEDPGEGPAGTGVRLGSLRVVFDTSGLLLSGTFPRTRPGC